MQKFLDANGVQYLWEQISLQDYPNNEVLAATIQAIDDVKLDKKDFPLNSGINQCLTTDSEGNKVWEDKICCTEIGEVTFFDEDILYPYADNIYNLYGYIESQPMIAGETYKVITNGTTYECVAKYDENSGIYIGNDSIQNPDSEDTGEPFFIMHIEPDSAAFCMLKEPHDDWTFTIVGPGKIIRVIPGEYIAGGLHKGSGKDSFCVKDTEANGDYAWALGGGTKANGYYSMALGLNSETKGAGCIAEGKSTIATSPYQHVQGTYNIEDTDCKYAHIIGNGKREYGVTTRSNAYTLDWNGNSYYAGDVYVQGDGKTLEFNGAKKVATEEYVNLKITNLINSAPETLDTIGEVAKALQEHQNVADALNSAISNKVNKTDIEGLASQSYVDTKVSELFQNVSDGKELIASAITDKGVYASEDETFQELSNKISLIPVGPPGSNIIGYIDEENDIYVSLTELENGTYTLKFEDQNGLLNDFDDIGTVEVK